MYSQISILRNHVYLAVQFGANLHELCRRLKLKPDDLNNGEGHARWEPSSDTDFWIQALDMTGIPTLGLQMGQRPSNLSAFGMLGLLAGSCRNMREAIETICKFNDTLTGVFKFSFEMKGNEGEFVFDPHPLWEETRLESARQAVDMLMSGFTKSFHDATGKKIYPIRTEVRYAKRFEEEYKQILRTPVIFNQKHNRFIFSKEYLETPLISHDASMQVLFKAQLQQKQKKLTENSLSERIKHVILSKFDGQITHIDIVSNYLCMTTRTLQRKLTEEKTSYRKLCQELRSELVSEIMKTGKLKKRELASLLGYADADSFNRAFSESRQIVTSTDGL